MAREFAALRKRIVQLHRSLGLIAALPFLVSAATGAMLVFEPELDRWCNRDVALVAPRGERLATQALAASAQEARPDDPLLRLMLWQQANSAAVFETRGRYRVYVDPYDGRVLGVRDMGAQLLPNLLLIHTTFLSGDAGSTIVGCSALALMLMCITGLFIWLPRGLKGFVVAWGRSRQRVLYDVHAAIGAWGLSVLLLIAVSGAAVTFQKSARQLLGALSSSEMYPVPTLTPPEDGVPALPLDTLLAAAPESATADALRITFPKKPGQPLRVTVYRTWAPFEGLLIDPYRGHVVASSTSNHGTLADAVYLQDFPIHTGSFGGLTTRLLWLIAIVAALALPVTGWMSWSRKRGSL